MTSSGMVNRSRVPRSGEAASACSARAVRSSWVCTVVMAATYPVASCRCQGRLRGRLASETVLAARPVRRPSRRALYADPVSTISTIPGTTADPAADPGPDRRADAVDVREPLLRRIAEGMPAYGSCAGMIMLADRIADARPDQQTLGGLDITVRRNAFGR